MFTTKIRTERLSMQDKHTSTKQSRLQLGAVSFKIIIRASTASTGYCDS